MAQKLDASIANRRVAAERRARGEVRQAVADLRAGGASEDAIKEIAGRTAATLLRDHIKSTYPTVPALANALGNKGITTVNSSTIQRNLSGKTAPRDDTIQAYFTVVPGDPYQQALIQEWAHIARRHIPQTDQSQGSARPASAVAPPSTAHDHGRPAAPTVPQYCTSYVPRALEEVENLATMACLVPGRLLTLHGPAGGGKTRLALEAARLLQDRYPDRWYWVSFEHVMASEQVLSAIAGAVGITPGVQDHQRLRDQVVPTLGPAPVLLILDAIEYVADAAHDIDRLLAACPHLRIIATGRQAFGVARELAVPVRRLTAFGPLSYASPAALDASSSAQLFLDRLQVQRAVPLTRTTIPLVAELCHWLEGLPLAIELVAPHGQDYGLDAILRGLEHTRARDSWEGESYPSREAQILQVTLLWSYQLLTPRQRNLLHQLAIQNDGWATAELQAVQGFTHALHETLTRSNLIYATVQDGRRRYHMTHAVREFVVAQTGAGHGAIATVSGWAHVRRPATYAPYAHPLGPYPAASDTCYQRVWDLFGAHEIDAGGIADLLRPFAIRAADLYDPDQARELLTLPLLRYLAAHFHVTEEWVQGRSDCTTRVGFREWKRMPYTICARIAALHADGYQINVIFTKAASTDLDAEYAKFQARCLARTRSVGIVLQMTQTTPRGYTYSTYQRWESQPWAAQSVRISAKAVMWFCEEITRRYHVGESLTYEGRSVEDALFGGMNGGPVLPARALSTSFRWPAHYYVNRDPAINHEIDDLHYVRQEFAKERLEILVDAGQWGLQKRQARDAGTTDSVEPETRPADGTARHQTPHHPTPWRVRRRGQASDVPGAPTDGKGASQSTKDHRLQQLFRWYR